MDCNSNQFWDKPVLYLSSGPPRDPNGGIMLSKPASQITLKQVLVVMEGIDSGAVKQRIFKKALIRYTDSVSRLIDNLKPESLNE